MSVYFANACSRKTSGGKGYHIVIPLIRRQGWDEAKSFSQAIARHMAKVLPDRFSAVLGPKNRVVGFSSLGEAAAQEESLTSFSILRMLDPEMTPGEFAKRAASAFFLRPKALL
jgi:hypothetical protein